jgi:F-type H+-transporting ATPase subunit a
MFINIARAYKKRPDQAPKGSQSFFEPIIEFVREEIAAPNLYNKTDKYMPLLLSLFFFIWFLNMAGMIPFSGNVTGNISVTLSLALISLAYIVASANKGYWKHIFLPPVPHGVKPILIPVEIIGVFTKPFALTIRLFANMTAGHVMMISLLALIFLFGKMGASPGIAWGTGIFSSLFIIFISVLELFVAALQAYVFTMLTAVFIGQAIENHNHNEEDII